MGEEEKQQENSESVDIATRLSEFNKKLGPLLAEYKLGIGATPVILDDGRLAAKPNVFDDSKRGKKAEEKESGGTTAPEGEKIEGGLAAAE